MPDPTCTPEAVARYLLERRAAEHPDRRFVTFAEEDRAWSWADADREANRMAHALARLGVDRGAVVGMVDDNTSALVRGLLGTWKLGAVASPLNTALRGETLGHALRVARPVVLLCGAPWAERLLDHRDDLPSTIVLHEPVAADVRRRLEAVATVRLLDDVLADAPASAADTAPPDPGLGPWDPHVILFTSGTTGPAKGVLGCYGQWHAQVRWTAERHCTTDDVFLGDLPLFHVGAHLALMAVLQLGASWVVLPRVRIERYWEVVRAHGVTHATLLAAIIGFLGTRPPRPDDADNPLRIVMMGKPGPGFDAWLRRFGIDATYSSFNTTEISSALVRDPDDDPYRTGRPRPGVEVRVVDDHDLEVADGTPGELVIRTDRPWEMNLGYVGRPDATAEAWRNGWFHTGDLFVRSPDGVYDYVDRAKDSIRRRGENISSFEVESAVLGHGAVRQCAAIAVPDGADGEAVKVCLVLEPGASLDPSALVEFLRPRLPHFAVPRYVEVLDSLPTTETGRVRKVELREAPLTPGTWDREAAGIVVTRHDP